MTNSASTAIAKAAANCGLSIVDAERCTALGLNVAEMTAVSQLPELYEGTTTTEIIGYVDGGMAVARVAESLRLMESITWLEKSTVPAVGKMLDSIGFTSTDEVAGLDADAGKFLVNGKQLTAAEFDKHLVDSIAAGNKPNAPAATMFHSPADDVVLVLVEAVSKLDVEGLDPLEYLMTCLAVSDYDGDVLRAYRDCMDNEHAFLVKLTGDEVPYTRQTDGDEFPRDILERVGDMGLSPRDLGLGGDGDEPDGDVDEELEEEFDDESEDD